MKTVAAGGGEWDGGRCVEPTKTWALTVRLATSEDMPGEGGSAGPRDGVVRPLVHVLDAKGVARLCPLLEIDRLRGTGAGGALGAGAVRRAARRGHDPPAPWSAPSRARSELDARFVRAAVEPGRRRAFASSCAGRWRGRGRRSRRARA